MNKLSAEQTVQVLAEVPTTLRKLAAERDFYKAAFTSSVTRQRIEKIAADMVDKGLRTGSPAAIADELEKQASSGDIDLAVTEKAVALVGSNMGKHAHISDELSGSSGSSQFEQFLMS